MRARRLQIEGRVPSARWAVFTTDVFVKYCGPRTQGGLAKGIGRTGGVEIAALLVPERGVVVLGVDQRMAPGDLPGRNELCWSPM